MKQLQESIQRRYYFYIDRAVRPIAGPELASQALNYCAGQLCAYHRYSTVQVVAVEKSINQGHIIS